MHSVTLNIYRKDIEHSEEESWSEYQINYDDNDVLLNLLMRIQASLDPTLAFSKNCRIGMCASCRIRVNKKPVLACSENVGQLVERYGNRLVLEPTLPEKCVRDLVIDLKFNKAIEPEKAS